LGIITNTDPLLKSLIVGLEGGSNNGILLYYEFVQKVLKYIDLL